jgi:hypothetical protein
MPHILHLRGFWSILYTFRRRACKKCQCLLLRVPAANSMEPNKLKRYLEKKHTEHVAKHRQAKHNVLTNTSASSGLLCGPSGIRKPSELRTKQNKMTHTVVFRVMMKCCTLVGGYQRVGGNSCRQQQKVTIKMEAVCSSEKSVLTYKSTTECHNAKTTMKLLSCITQDYILRKQTSM